MLEERLNGFFWTVGVGTTVLVIAALLGFAGYGLLALLG